MAGTIFGSCKIFLGLSCLTFGILEEIMFTESLDLLIKEFRLSFTVGFLVLLNGIFTLHASSFKNCFCFSKERPFRCIDRYGKHVFSVVLITVLALSCPLYALNTKLWHACLEAVNIDDVYDQSVWHSGKCRHFTRAQLHTGTNISFSITFTITVTLLLELSNSIFCSGNCQDVDGHCCSKTFSWISSTARKHRDMDEMSILREEDAGSRSDIDQTMLSSV